jgi:hypothetical protein
MRNTVIDGMQDDVLGDTQNADNRTDSQEVATKEAQIMLI